jgi:superfamily II DNA helicase RecQ
MERESQIGMGESLNISAYRQIAIAIGRRYFQDTPGFEADNEADREDAADEEGCWWTANNNVLDLQLGHSTYVAGTIYARGVDEAPNTVARMTQQFRAASERWHRFLGFPSAVRAGQKRRQREVDGAMRAKQFAQWQAMRMADTQPMLERIVGAGGRFRGIQQPAIKAIMGGVPWVLGIMGTRGGKSMIFMVPAAWERAGTTIVVVPTVSLRQDMQRECKKAGISCVPWNSHWPPETATMVLVTPKSAVKKGFWLFISRLEDQNRLDRIVIDKCHTLLDSHEFFRPKMKKLHRLMTIGCPVVILTAILTAQDQGRLLTRLKLTPKDVRVFRSQHTTRTNIRYRIQHVDGRDDQVVAFIREQEARWHPSGGKMIVYSATTGRVEQLAEQLGCGAYHGQMPQPIREQALDTFTQAPVGVTVVATNALGVGINIPNVRSVIHVEVPAMLRDYSQESGRAGRDGQPSKAIIIAPRTYQAPKWHQWEEGTTEGKEAMKTYFQQDRCRQKTLDTYLDSWEARERYEVAQGEEACNICEGGRQQTTPPAQLSEVVALTDMRPAIVVESDAMWFSGRGPARPKMAIQGY